MNYAQKAEPAIGWGRRVGGTRPYLSWEISNSKSGIELSEPYHAHTRVVLLTVREWRRLQRKAGERK